MYGNGFYNPYMYQPYFQASRAVNGLSGLSNVSGAARSGFGGLSNIGGAAGGSIGKGLLGLGKKFSFSGLLDGASKTLNIVNQAIPVFYQVKPMISNAKTMFRIMGAVKDTDSPSKNVTKINTVTNNNTSNYTNPTKVRDESPTFFI